MSAQDMSAKEQLTDNGTPDNMTTPDVTVVMAVYNATQYLPDSMSSLFAQTLDSWELICVDDGSTDGSLPMLHQYAASDARIRVLAQENAGPAQARAKAYAIARAEYALQLDADDTIEPDYLRKLVATAKETGADAVFADLMQEQTPGRADYRSFNAHHGMAPDEVLPGKEAFSRSLIWLVHGFCLWKSSLLREHAVGSNAALNNYNADEYITRLLLYHANLAAVSKAKYYLRKNQESITQKFSVRRFRGLETNQHLIEFCQSHGLFDKNYHHFIDKHRRKILRFQVMLLKNKNQLTGPEYLEATTIVWNAYQEFRRCIHDSEYNISIPLKHRAVFSFFPVFRVYAGLRVLCS